MFLAGKFFQEQFPFEGWSYPSHKIVINLLWSFIVKKNHPVLFIYEYYIYLQDFTREQAKAAFELADSNRDGVIDVSEFIQLMFPSAKELVINIR